MLSPTPQPCSVVPGILCDFQVLQVINVYIFSFLIVAGGRPAIVIRTTMGGSVIALVWKGEIVGSSLGPGECPQAFIDNSSIMHRLGRGQNGHSGFPLLLTCFS